MLIGMLRSLLCGVLHAPPFLFRHPKYSVGLIALALPLPALRTLFFWKCEFMLADSGAERFWIFATPDHGQFVDALMRSAISDISPKRRFVVYAGDGRFPLAKDVEAIRVREMCEVTRSAR